MSNCYFHPEKPATHTDSVVDEKESGIHTIAYKRVAICEACAIERSAVNTSRVEVIHLGLSEPNFFRRA
jgi:hypothetical protein